MTICHAPLLISAVLGRPMHQLHFKKCQPYKHPSPSCSQVMGGVQLSHVHIALCGDLAAHACNKSDAQVP